MASLVEDAYALTGSSKSHPRKDFGPEEMRKGTILYFGQVDNLTGKAVYRMRIMDVAANRIVYEVENVTTMRYYLLPIFHPGDLQSMYFLDRQSDKVWRC